VAAILSTSAIRMIFSRTSSKEKTHLRISTSFSRASRLMATALLITMTSQRSTSDQWEAWEAWETWLISWRAWEWEAGDVLAVVLVLVLAAAASRARSATPPRHLEAAEPRWCVPRRLFRTGNGSREQSHRMAKQPKLLRSRARVAGQPEGLAHGNKVVECSAICEAISVTN